MWKSVNASSLLVHTVFVFIETRVFVENQWYETDREKICAATTRNTLHMLWVVAFVLISVTGHLYFGPNGYEDSPHFVVAFVVYALNVVLIKLWNPLFASNDKKHLGLALFVAILLVITSGTLLALMVLNGAWVTVYVYGVYVLWTLYVVFLNYQLFTYKPGDPPEKKAQRPVRSYVPRPPMKKRPVNRKLDIKL